MAPDSRILAQAIDQVLVVVRADETPRDAVVEAVSAIGRTSAVTLMLNAWTPLMLSRGDSYGTYYGYGTRAHQQPR
jgi:hypothetical protein